MEKLCIRIKSYENELKIQSCLFHNFEKLKLIKYYILISTIANLIYDLFMLSIFAKKI